MPKAFSIYHFLLLFLSILFIGVNGYFLFHGNYYFSLVPLAVSVVYFSFYKTKELLFFVILCTPFSLNLEQLSLGNVGFYLPTEPILFGLMILLSIRALLRGTYDKKLLNHPITLSVLFYLFWMGITVFTSSNPIVSVKFLIAKLWFVIPLFFYLIIVFRKKETMYRVVWLYLISLSVVVLITLVRHYTWGFDQKAAHWIMSPFYKDHTSYGAIVAFYIPLSIGLLYRKKNSAIIQYILILFLVILSVGLLYSYTRAAWVSLVAALGVWALFKLKIHVKYVVLLALFGGFVGYQYYTDISIALSKNKTDSSENISKHIESISNVSTDASNLERINRWNCAIRMFQERPVFGWGPGTYAFEYAPFQHSSEITVISTNFGNRGNAHSEYLGALSEMGVLGLCSFLVLLFFVFYKGSKLFIELEDKELKTLLLSVMLALVSYFVHGVLNNYLDTDKASVPVWTCFAIIVAIDIYHSKQPTSSSGIQ
jgi:O-antigen ligase